MDPTPPPPKSNDTSPVRSTFARQLGAFFTSSSRKPSKPATTNNNNSSLGSSNISETTTDQNVPPTNSSLSATQNSAANHSNLSNMNILHDANSAADAIVRESVGSLVGSYTNLSQPSILSTSINSSLGDSGELGPPTTFKRGSTTSKKKALPNAAHLQKLKEQLAQDHKELIEFHSRIWLDSLNVPLANIFTLPPCLTLISYDGNGSHDLVVADVGETPSNLKVTKEELNTIKLMGGSNWFNMETRLKRFQGNKVVSEFVIETPPTAIVSFYPDHSSNTNSLPRLPILALASGPYIYMYKQNKPLFKYTLPKIMPDPHELEIWEYLKEASIQASEMAAIEFMEGRDPTAIGIDAELVERAFEELRVLRDQKHVRLTDRSLKLLSLEGDTLMGYARAVGDADFYIQPVITCMVKLPRQTDEEDAMSCLLLGSEECVVYLISPPGYSIIEKFQLSSPISFLGTTGSYETEYTIISACRDGSVYILKNNMCNRLVQLQYHTCGLVVFNTFIVVACLNNTVYAYDFKGRLQFEMKMPSPITLLEEIKYSDKNFYGYAVCMENKEVYIFSGNNLVSILSPGGVVVALRFGSFGREPGSLVMVLKGGGLVVKILKRQANFNDLISVNSKKYESQTTRELDIPIPVPRKTKLYLEIADKERENGHDIHQKFQNDFMKLKLAAAKAFATTLTHNLNPLENKLSSSDIKLKGMGPKFRLNFSFRNNGSKCVYDLMTFVTANSNHHYLKPSSIHIPCVPPGTQINRHLFVDSIVTNGKGVPGRLEIFTYEGSAVDEDTVATLQIKQSAAIDPLIVSMIDIPIPALLFE